MFNKIIFFIFILYQFNTFSQECNTPLLLLHLDVNKTLIAEDQTAGQSLEFMIASEIAEKTVHQWEPNLPPMSYADYVRKILVPGATTKEIKEKRKKILRNFINILENSDHPDKNAIIAQYYTCIEKMEGRYLIPSFVKFLCILKEQKAAFRIILRTYGNDIRLGKVTKEIESVLDGDRFFYRGSFKKGTLKIKGMDSMRKAEEIYLFFRDTIGHVAIQDDWKTWLKDNKRRRSGKPFIFDPADKEILSLFFDDNINSDPDSEFGIVNLLPINESEVSSSLLHKLYLRKVETIEAILDDDYFLKLIKI